MGSTVPVPGRPNPHSDAPFAAFAPRIPNSPPEKGCTGKEGTPRANTKVIDG